MLSGGFGERFRQRRQEAFCSVMVRTSLAKGHRSVIAYGHKTLSRFLIV
jgi:hypothetical protein